MNKRLAGLTAVAAVLAGYVAYEGLGVLPSDSGGEQPAVGAAAPRGAGVKLNPLEGLDPESFTAIVEQPLFNPTRQPRPVEAPPPPAVEQPMVEQPPPPPPPAPQGPGPDDYKLLGVSAGPDGRIAALRISASGQVVYLRQGESVDGWTVVAVSERSVDLGTAENPVTYSMFAAADGDAGGDDGMGDAAPAPSQPLPLPLPLPMPKQPAQPAPQPGQPPLPEQYTLPDTGG